MTRIKNRMLLLSTIIVVPFCFAYLLQVMGFTYSIKGKSSAFFERDNNRSRNICQSGGLKDFGGTKSLNMNECMVVLFSSQKSYFEPVLDSFFAILFKMLLFPNIILMLLTGAMRHWKSVQQIIMDYIEGMDGKKRKKEFLLLCI